MDSLKNLLNRKHFKKVNTNPTFLLAEEIAQATNSSPMRWLRQVKAKPDFMRQKLACFKDMIRDNPPKHRLSLFLWSIKN